MTRFAENRFRSLSPALVAALGVSACGFSANAAAFEQGFEADASGWFTTGSGAITRVASGAGALGVASADGSFHAEVTIGSGAVDSGTGSGGFTRFGGYNYTWPGQIVQSLDVYIDPSAGAVGDGWYLDNAVSDNVNDNDGVTSGSDWREAGGVGALKATDGNWWITADADGAAYQGPATGGVGLQITTAGWYTIVSEWNANADGLTVDRDTFIYDSAGNLLYSDLNPQQVPLTGAFPIGGNRYGWIAAANDATSMTLAIDNTSLTVPEPGSLALLGLGGLAMIRRRRRA